MGPGTLVISRARDHADMLRRYRIVLNGREVGTIKRGGELRVTVPAGDHEVVARIDWAGSNALTVGVRAGEITELEVGSSIEGWRFLAVLYLITFGRNHYPYLRHRVVGFPILPRAAGNPN